MIYFVLLSRILSFSRVSEKGDEGKWAGARRCILGEEYPDTRSAAKDLARRINRGSQKRCHKWMPKGGE